MTFTSITLSFDDTDFLNLLMKYLQIKDVRIVNLQTCTETPNEPPTYYIFDKDDFDELYNTLKPILFNEAGYFFLEATSIKTSFEKFTYGIEAQSYQKDFKEFFSEYDQDE